MKSSRPSYFQKVQRQRYASRSFRNPYFQEKKPSSVKFFVLLAAAFALISGGVGCLFALPQLAIERVVTEGTETIDPAVLTSAIQQYLGHSEFLVFRRSNRFLFDPNDLQAHLLSTFAFDMARAERLGDTITVHVRERHAQLIWKSGTSRYLVDPQGHVIRPLTDQEGGRLDAPTAPSDDPSLAILRRLPVFADVNASPILGMPAVLTTEEITGAARFHQTLLDQALPFVETRVDRLAGKWMAVKTLAGYDILFDPTGDAAAQATRLQTVLRDSVKNPKALTYIDLRFGNHVYYK